MKADGSFSNEVPYNLVERMAIKTPDVYSFYSGLLEPVSSAFVDIFH